MAKFNVIRAGRKQDGYMDKLIKNMFLDSRAFLKRGYGICADSPDIILCGFNSVRAPLNKPSLIKCHYLELSIGYDEGKDAALMTADILGRFLLGIGFQSYISAIDSGTGYLIAVVINAVSFSEPQMFHDNNYQYLMILDYLNRTTPLKWSPLSANATFFDPKVGEGNYEHGLEAY